MPAYQGHLSAAELDALVGYIGSLKALGAGAAEARTAATDPVCGMRVSAGKGTPSVQRGGKTYYFCSDACRQRFEKQPAK
jgi:Cu+-exporting ATPase